MTTHYLDIETTTDHKTIRLVGVRADGLNYTFSNLALFKSYLGSVVEEDTIVTYNGEGFDYPVLKDVWGLDIPDLAEKNGVNLHDAYIMSKLAFNDRPSHALDSWAQEIDPTFTKLEVDYDNASLSVLESYLRRDLEITERVYKRILSEVGVIRRKAWGKGGAFSFTHALRVETAVRRMMNDQRKRGFPFHTSRAVRNKGSFLNEMKKLEADAARFMPIAPLPESKLDYPPKIQFKKDGSLSKHMENWLVRNDASFSTTTRSVLKDGMLYPLPLTQPLATHSRLTLNDTNRLKDWLLSQGWEPTLYNYDSDGKKKSPKLLNTETKQPCPNLYKYLDGAVVDMLAEYATLKSRANQIGSESSGLLSRVEDDGTIKHDADTLGTPTGRMRHKKVVNIPRVSSTGGKEIRELFTPFPSQVMVGWDAASLEARMEAHYVHPFDPDYAEELVTGDVHERNLKLLSLPDRDTAKKFKYMIMYGAGIPKIAFSLGISEAQAKEWYHNFWDANTGLKRFMAHLKDEWQVYSKKYIKGLDGRLLQTRSEHALLNTKLQGAGAIVMKHAMLIAEKEIIKVCPYAMALIRYHDEEQWSVPHNKAEEVGEIGVQSIVKAGRYLKLNVPLAGEYKVGKSWAECH